MIFKKLKEKNKNEKTVETEKKEEKRKKEKTPLTAEQKKKRRKRIIIGTVAAGVLAVTLLPKLFKTEVLPVVTVSEAGIGEVEQTIEGSGTVKAEEMKTYFSPVSATVASFDLKVGDTVEAGETLLTYNETELKQLYKQAELTGSAANYAYQDAVTKNNENESEFKRSSEALDTIEQQLDEEKKENKHVQNRIAEYTGKQAEVQQLISEQQAVVSDAQSKIDQAKKDRETAKENGETEKIIEANKVIEEQAPIRDAAKQKLLEAQEELQTINEKLDGYEERLETSGENLEELQTDKATEQAIKDSSDAAILSSAAKQELAANNNLSSLNAQMTKDDINAGKSGIKAEFSGVVTEVGAVSGGPAVKGGSLFSVASREKVIVDMSVTRYDLEKLEVGQSAEITLAGKSYAGTVSRLSRLAAANEKGTPVVSAEIHIDNPDENIYLGLEANVKVSGHKVEDVIVVPVEAVNTGRDGSFCYTVENGIVVKKEVETGLSSAALVEITSGLTAGDKVVRSGAEMIEEGMKVTAVEE